MGSMNSREYWEHLFFTGLPLPRHEIKEWIKSYATPYKELMAYYQCAIMEVETKFRVLEKYDGYTKLALTPVTGRTHQLRLHCAYMGFPILGDPQYGSEASIAFSARWDLTHQLLCASTLKLPHPVTGQFLVLHSQYHPKLL